MLEVRVSRSRDRRAVVAHVAEQNGDDERARRRLVDILASPPRARLEHASGTATVAGDRVAVVALLARKDQPIAANARAPALAIAFRLDRARWRAAVVRNEVAVVALLEAFFDSIAAFGLVADRPGPRCPLAASKAGLKSAGRAARIVTSAAASGPHAARTAHP